MMAISEETCAARGGFELSDGIVGLDGDGVPEVWGEGFVPIKVDETAEGQVVLGEFVGNECY